MSLAKMQRFRAIFHLVSQFEMYFLLCGLKGMVCVLFSIKRKV